MTDALLDIAKITLPAGIVLYAAYLMVKSFLDKQLLQENTQRRALLSKEILPLRLQAYERICIFLERITPNNLVIRLNDSNYNVYQFQNILIHEIREEYQHNLSQQIYMSDEAWSFVRKAMEEIIALINNAAYELDKEAPALKLAKKIFENVMMQDEDMNAQALKYIKREIRELF
jgi:hypothetical protein